MMFRRILLIGASALLLSLTAVAQDKPDFSGTWKMNMEKTDYGPMPRPDKYDAKIEHKDPEMRVAVTQVNQQGERSTEAVYYSDGKESANKMGPAEIKSKGKWDGKTLVIDSKLDFQGNEILINEKWNLAEDGKSINIDRNIQAPQGEVLLKVVLEKQ